MYVKRPTPTSCRTRSGYLQAKSFSYTAYPDAEIDRLDRSLVKLPSERQRYIEGATEIKSRRGEIRDLAQAGDVYWQWRRHGVGAAAVMFSA